METVELNYFAVHALVPRSDMSTGGRSEGEKQS